MFALSTCLVLLTGLEPAESRPAWLIALDAAENHRLARHPAEAESAYRQALQIARQTAPHTEAEALVMHNLGFFYQQAGDLAQAERWYLAAQRWFAAHQPHFRTSQIRLVTNLAVLYAQASRWDETAALLRPWLHTHQAQHEPDLARLRGVFAAALARQGNYREAEPLLASVRGVLEAERPSHLQQESLALILSNQGALYGATGRPAQALAHYEQALAILTPMAGRAPASLFVTLHDAAVTLIAAKRTAEALTHYERAMAVAERYLPPRHPILIIVLQGYAHLLKKLHRGAEAKALARRVRSLRDEYESAPSVGQTVDVRAFR